MNGEGRQPSHAAGHVAARAETSRMDTGLRGNDPGHWGHSLANLGEMLFPLLDAIGARSVVEVGAYAGDLTRDLVSWAQGAGARVIAIDPTPQPELVELAEQRSELELIRETSHEALRRLSLPDAVIIDGDHNYYTVSGELRHIGERAPGADGPLLVLHDVCWPHARRDVYYAPERIPDEHRQPMVEGGGVFPGDPGIVDAGLPYKWVARREGGPRNGVLTALEDFVEGRSDLRVATVPAFFGLGIMWPREAPWTDAVAEIVEPWDRNPLLARLEANRVLQLASLHAEGARLNAEIGRLSGEIATLRWELDTLRQRNREQESMLRGLLASKPFALADRISGLRHPGRERSWRDQARQVLDGETRG
jgi:hypothetical protein